MTDVSQPAVADQQDEILAAIMGRMKPITEARPNLKGLIFSQPGGRKTSFLGQIPNNLIIDSEDGLTSLHNDAVSNTIQWDTIQVLPFMSFYQIEQLTDRLKKRVPQLNNFETVSVDTLTTLHKKGLAEEVKRQYEKGVRESQFKAETEDHASNNERMRQIVDSLKDLDRNIILTCHAKEVQQKDKSIKIYPDFSEKLANTINGMMDFVAFVEQTENGVIWHNVSDGYIQCKNRIGLPRTLENPTWETIQGYFEKHLANSRVNSKDSNTTIDASK